MLSTRLIRKLALCGIAVIALAGAGQSGPPSLVAFGAGALPCEAWLEHPQMEDPDHVVMASWMDGYLTAAVKGRSAEEVRESFNQYSDGAARDSWVAQYCRAHSDEPLFRAAGALL